MCLPDKGKSVAIAGALTWRKALKLVGNELLRRHDLHHTWLRWHVKNLKELSDLASYEKVQRYANQASLLETQ